MYAHVDEESFASFWVWGVGRWMGRDWPWVEEGQLSLEEENESGGDLHLRFSRPSPHWACNSKTPMRGVWSYDAGAAIGAVMRYG